MEKIALEELTPYENVHFFDFSMMEEIFGLEHYCDDYHFDDVTCRKMFEMMKAEEGRFTEENWQEKLETQRQFFEAVDYSEIYF